MKTSLSRRTLVRGAAWSAPAIAATAAIPAYAASTAPTNDNCDLSGSIDSLMDFTYGTSTYNAETDTWSRTSENRWTITHALVNVKGLNEGESITSQTLTYYVENLPANADLTQEPTGFFQPDASTSFVPVTNGQWNYTGTVEAPALRTLNAGETTYSSTMWGIPFQTQPGGIQGSYSDQGTADLCRSFSSMVIQEPAVADYNNSTTLQREATPGEHFVPNSAIVAEIKTNQGRTLTITAVSWNNGMALQQSSVAN